MPKRFFHDKKEKDLFEDLQTADKNIRKKVRLQLPRLKNRLSLSYENLIFLAIGFVMCSIIFFSLGVEKGRQDTNRVKSGLKNEKRVKVPALKPKKQKAQKQDKYIIQLAAFKEKRSAKKELVQLEKEGYTGSTKRVGAYYQLYVTGFSKKKEAEDALKGLQKKYKDCYVKQL